MRTIPAATLGVLAFLALVCVDAALWRAVRANRHRALWRTLDILRAYVADEEPRR